MSDKSHGAATYAHAADVQRLAPDYLLPAGEVQRLVGLSKSAIYRRMEENAFPRPRRLSGNCVRWRHSEIIAWMDALPVAEGQKAGL